MRALIAASLAALAAISYVVCWRGLLPGLAVVAPMTLAFVGACVGVLGATDEDASATMRRYSLAATIAATIVLIVASGLFLSTLGRR